MNNYQAWKISELKTLSTVSSYGEPSKPMCSISTWKSSRTTQFRAPIFVDTNIIGQWSDCNGMLQSVWFVFADTSPKLFWRFVMDLFWYSEKHWWRRFSFTCHTFILGSSVRKIYSTLVLILLYVANTKQLHTIWKLWTCTIDKLRMNTNVLTTNTESTTIKISP